MNQKFDYQTYIAKADATAEKRCNLFFSAVDALFARLEAHHPLLDRDILRLLEDEITGVDDLAAIRDEVEVRILPGNGDYLDILLNGKPPSSWDIYAAIVAVVCAAEPNMRRYNTDEAKEFFEYDMKLWEAGMAAVLQLRSAIVFHISQGGV